MKTLNHSRKCLSTGKDLDCKFCRSFNSGYWDARADIENNRPKKWDAEGNLISITDQRKGFALKHFNDSYVKGYTKGFEYLDKVNQERLDENWSVLCL